MRCLTPLVAALTLALATGFAGPLSSPDLTAYNPVDLLCRIGIEPVDAWCKDWVSCIKGKASEKGTAAAVKDAWKPAACKEICGQWPSMTKSSGSGTSKSKSTSNSGIKKAKFSPQSMFLQGANHLNASISSKSGDCLKSCERFQSHLSSCVANILFEPGKVAAMGAPLKYGQKAPPEICTKKDTPCQPDLEINHQKCLGHHTKRVLDSSFKMDDKISQGCKMFKQSMKDCEQCPQMKENYQSAYTAFTGGCLDMLHAYWKATHPGAGVAAIAGATGCTVHAKKKTKSK